MTAATAILICFGVTWLMGGLSAWAEIEVVRRQVKEKMPREECPSTHGVLWLAFLFGPFLWLVGTWATDK